MRTAPSNTQLQATAKARAFSLAESLFAMTIVSFVLLAIIGIMPSGLGSLRDAERRAAEIRICQTLTADYEGRSWSALGNLATQPLYYDDRGVASHYAPDDPNNPTLSPTYAAQAQLVFDPAKSLQSMTSAGLLPGESVASPYLRYVRIAITPHASDIGPMQQALNGTDVPFVHVFTIVLANLEPELPVTAP